MYVCVCGRLGSEQAMSAVATELAALEEENTHRMSELKEQQQHQLLTLRQDQYYSEQYLKGKHIKQVLSIKFSHYSPKFYWLTNCLLLLKST